MKTEESAELLHHFQRDINCLLEEDRNLRKKGLTSLMNDLFKEDISHKVELSLELFQRHILKYLIKLFDDKIEKHREYVINLVEKFLDLVSKNKQLAEKDALETITKGILLRLNTIPYNEASEELRLRNLVLLNKIVSEFPDSFVPIISDYSFMIIKILADSYPDSKKEAAVLLIRSSEKLRKLIGFHSVGIFKALAINTTHQHSKVRKATLEAISSLILAEGAGASLEVVYNSLKTLISDKIIDVRKTVIECLSQIINGLSLTNLKESESKLVYLLLTGLSDENDDIVKVTINLLEDVGLKRKLLALEFGENSNN